MTLSARTEMVLTASVLAAYVTDLAIPRVHTNAHKTFGLCVFVAIDQWLQPPNAPDPDQGSDQQRQGRHPNP